MKATKIKMKHNYENSRNVQDIDSIYIDAFGTYWEKSKVYDYLKQFPKTIAVNIPPYPNLIPVLSPLGEKYVRSKANRKVEPKSNIFSISILRYNWRSGRM